MLAPPTVGEFTPKQKHPRQVTCHPTRVGVQSVLPGCYIHLGHEPGRLLRRWLISLQSHYSTPLRHNQDRTCVLWAGLALGHGDLTTMVVIVHPTLKSSPIGELLPTTERGVAVEKFHQWWNFCKRPSGALMPIGIVRPTRAGASLDKSCNRLQDLTFPPRGRGRHNVYYVIHICVGVHPTRAGAPIVPLCHMCQFTPRGRGRHSFLRRKDLSFSVHPTRAGASHLLPG